MHVAGENGNEQLFSYFVKQKGDYLQRNYADETPFHLAAREGKLNILQLYTKKFQFDIEMETMVMIVLINWLGWVVSNALCLNEWVHIVCGIPSQEWSQY